MCKNNGTNDKFSGKVAFRRYVEGLNLGLKARKQLPNQNHTKGLALGSHPRDNVNVGH